MQPKRDPSDRRYWPARLGGTGQGFTTGGKDASPAYYGALKPHGSLSDHPHPAYMTEETVQYASDLVTPEAVKARARVVALKALDRLVCQSDSMDVPQSLSVLGGVARFTEAASERGSAGVTLNFGDLHLAALQAARPVVQARMLSNEGGNVSDDDTLPTIHDS